MNYPADNGAAEAYIVDECKMTDVPPQQGTMSMLLWHCETRLIAVRNMESKRV
jgi:hypothetical protein